MLYYDNHPYYPNRNKGIDLFVVSIITIVTGIYDSRWLRIVWKEIDASLKPAIRNHIIKCTEEEAFRVLGITRELDITKLDVFIALLYVRGAYQAQNLDV